MSEIFEREPEYGNSVGRVNMTGYSGSKWREVRIDSSTRATTTITYPHHEIHAGRFYSVNDVIDIAGNKSVTNLFVTPITIREVHMWWSFNSQAETDFKLYEGVTVTSSGTPITIHNRCRCSLNTSSALIYTGAVVSATGTALLIHHHWGSGKDGGDTREVNEWILKSNTVYSSVVVNEVATANQITFNLDWYEHTPRAE